MARGKKRNPKLVLIRVTTERLFVIEEGSINGWSTDRVIQEWFHDFPLDTWHASRDTSTVGSSSYLLGAEAMEIGSPEEIEYTAKCQRRGKEREDRRLQCQPRTCKDEV